MKIAVASSLGWPYVRRGSRCPYEMASYLANRGHEVHYITTKPGIVSRHREKNGIYAEYHKLLSSPILSVMKVQNLDTFVLPCLRSILKNDFDIVQTFLPMDAFAASIARTIKGTSFVHFMIDRFQPHYCITKYGRFMLRRGIKLAARVTAVSNFIIDDVKTQFNIDALLTPPPVDTDQFTLCEKKDFERPRILYTSSIHDPRKGFLILVKAFEKLLDYVPNAQLQLSGHVHPRSIEIIFNSVSARTKKNIEILGVGKREDLPDLYRNAAVTVLPSLNEPFGMVLTESLASGTPIVGSRSGGIVDIIKNNEIGVLFDPEEGPEGLCKAILRGLELSRNPDVWKKCREHAESFSWNSVGPQFEKLYEEIVDTNSRKRARTFTKNEKASETAAGSPLAETQTKKADLQTIFDDALDEIEIDYDNYYRVDRYKPLCTYVAGWLLNNGLQRGAVLVISRFTFPLNLLLEKCGFTVRGIEITQEPEPWNALGIRTILSDIDDLRDEPGCYDIVICDNILQYCKFPIRALQIIRDKLNREGTLILVSENATNERKKEIAGYRGYTLKEAEKMTAEAGFTVTQGGYVIREKAIEGSLFAIPFFLYFYKRLHYFIQKAFPPLRGHIFLTAKKNLYYES